MAEQRKYCPCHFTSPCKSSCSCANPHLSGACERCCTHGSLDQQKKKAEALARWFSEFKASAKLVWSATPPAEEGYWWHRESSSDEPVIANVQMWGDGLRVSFGDGAFPKLCLVGGEWSGPLVPPGEG